MDYLKHIRQKYRYSSIVRVLLDGLAKLGIKILIYYRMLEELHEDVNVQVDTGFADYEFGFFTASDMKAMAAIPFRKPSEEELLQRLREGKKCFGAKHNGQLIAFSWYALNKGEFLGHRFILRENEAYLDDAFTHVEYRGKGLAPYIRYKLYDELRPLGRYKLYSISDYFNTPSIRFKLKLNAKFYELGLLLDFFRKWRYHKILKRYF
jgi:GNAT superfamily N-acetyltransferase